MRRIEIIGGGLAGLSLGIVLRQRGIAVVVQEAGRYPRHRVCGEFLTGLSKETITSLGLTELVAGSPVHREVTWKRHGRVHRRDALPSAVPGISRWDLDHALAKRLRVLGGELREAHRVKLEARAGLVGSDGRPKTPGRFLGLKGHFRGFEGAEGLEMHLGDGGYLGVSAVGDDWWNVCGLFEARRVARVPDARERFLATLRMASMGELAARLTGAEVREGSLCATPVAGFGRFPARETGLLRLGDAWAMPPPYTGHGMAMALRSGLVAAESLAAYAREEIDWPVCISETKRGLSREFGRRLRIGTMLHPFLRKRWALPGLLTVSRIGCLPFGLAFSLTHT